MIPHSLSAYIPAEDSRTALAIQQAVGIARHLVRLGKVAAVLSGVAVLIRAYRLFAGLDIAPPPGSRKAASAILKAFGPLLLDLLTQSLDYLWLPIALYLLVALCTRAFLWRKFWCLVGFGWFVLKFAEQAQALSWKEYHLLPVLIVQGYLCLLWVLPREAWNVIGLALSLVFGLVILILPDLPTAFDDFGLFGAILVYFLGYVNLIGSVTDRVATRIRKA